MEFSGEMGEFRLTIRATKSLARHPPRMWSNRQRHQAHRAHQQLIWHQPTNVLRMEAKVRRDGESGAASTQGALENRKHASATAGDCAYLWVRFVVSASELQRAGEIRCRTPWRSVSMTAARPYVLEHIPAYLVATLAFKRLLNRLETAINGLGGDLIPT